MLCKFRIYHIPLIAALLIASIQYVLSSAYNLTRWEGGGFGMYSEISQKFSRIAWIRIENSNGDFWIRMCPLDPNLNDYINRLPEKKLKNWKKLIKKSCEIRNFPEFKISENYIKDLGNALLNTSKKKNELMRKNNSKINVHLDVVEISLDINEKVFKKKKIYSMKVEI